MTDSVFGIDKGIIKAFVLMIVIVGALTTFFLSEYISTVLLGSVFFTATNGTTDRYTAVTGEDFIGDNTTPRLLANSPLIDGALTIENSTGFSLDLGNFTVELANGSILLNNVAFVVNGSTLTANYTYVTRSSTSLPISSDASTFLSAAEDDFVTTFTSVNTGVKFAAALITVVAVILVFASFLPKKRKKDNLDF